MIVERKETLLKVENVSLSFGENLILREINLEVKNIIGRGQVVGFLGPSGIGKTQLLRILAGFQKPTEGRVLLGEDSKPVVRGQVGMVSQKYELLREFTVLGNLMVGARFAGMTKKEAKERAMELLEDFGLADRARYHPAQLSGGQQQRVAIAQQLLCSEDFLLMDEPFSGLDPVRSEKVCSLITDLAKKYEKFTTVVVTHGIREAASVADTIWIMGREHDAEGNSIPGGRIVKEYDLLAMDLAWREGIRATREFAEFTRQLEAEFSTLE